MAKHYSKNDLSDRYLKEFSRLRKEIETVLKDLLTVPEAGIVIELFNNDDDSPSSSVANIVAYYPDLMDERQAKADLADMRSIARSSKLFKELIGEGTYSQPSYSDLYRGILPNISITVKLL